MKIAVIIATYIRRDNRTPFLLKRSIKSVLSQTHKDSKLYVIGDKYENELEFNTILTSYPQDKIFFKNLDHAVEREKYTGNKLWLSGGVNAFNQGISQAISEGFNYMCYLDHDDYWTPDHLETISGVIDKEHADWICTISSYHLGDMPKKGLEAPPGGYIEFFPEGGKLIKSSACFNHLTIPLRLRDVSEQIIPSDSDLWNRIGNYLCQAKGKSFVINKKTCFHDEEGFETR